MDCWLEAFPLPFKKSTVHEFRNTAGYNLVLAVLVILTGMALIYLMLATG